MQIKTVIATGLGLMMLGAVPAMAQEGPRTYAYHSHANYCPAGLQPITISGVICCGTPNQPTSYQAMLRHPVKVKRKRHYRKAARAACPVGTKGCTFD